MNILTINQKIAPILHAYGVTYAAVFGSHARGEETNESDLDLLITLRRPIGVFALARLKRELEEVIGRPVDLVTTNALSPHVSPYIRADLKELAL
jgi:uncharacterized protein